MSLLIGMLSGWLWAAGFSSGAHFDSTAYFGTVDVLCRKDGGTKVTSFSCRKSALSPVESDVFVGPSGVQADKVILINRMDNRSMRTRTEYYDPFLNRTRTINLWQSTVLNPPLLALGLNRITYQLYLGDELQTEGQVSVIVSRKPTMRCESREIIATRPTYCENQLWACETYFNIASCGVTQSQKR